jgi:hypothetical protein
MDTIETKGEGGRVADGGDPLLESIERASSLTVLSVVGTDGCEG